jgi:hypothetical protein
MIKIIAPVLAGLLFAATPAAAMSGLEYLRAEQDQYLVAYHAMKSLVTKFIDQGYRNVPSPGHLMIYSEELIRQKGYRDKDIAEIAEEGGAGPRHEQMTVPSTVKRRERS